MILNSEKQIMEFCPDCDNILIPRKEDPSNLFCKVCDKIVKLKNKPIEEYKISHKLRHSATTSDVIVKRKKIVITEEDRRGFEDLYYDS